MGEQQQDISIGQADLPAPEALHLQQLLAVQNSVCASRVHCITGISGSPCLATSCRALRRLRRLADTKAQLTKLDKRQLAKVDEACAEIEANSKLLVLIQEDLTHVFRRVRHAWFCTTVRAAVQRCVLTTVQTCAPQGLDAQPGAAASRSSGSWAHCRELREGFSSTLTTLLPTSGGAWSVHAGGTCMLGAKCFNNSPVNLKTTKLCALMVHPGPLQ